MTAFPAEVSNETLEYLTGVFTEFVEELDGPPTLGEFLEILSRSMPSTDAIAGTIVPPVRFTAKLTGDRRYRVPKTTRVDELNDAVFVEATEFLASLAASARDAAERAIKLSVVGQGVAKAVRSAGVTFADVAAGDLAAITAKGQTGVKAAVGDVVAVPARGSGYHLAVVITRNTSGTALGILLGVVPEPTLDGIGEPDVWPYPVYTSDEHIAVKKWPIAGHDESLLARFSADPEIYHYPDAKPVSEFGLAETFEGALRRIGEQESRDVGILDGTYRQYLNPELFEKFLERFE